MHSDKAKVDEDEHEKAIRESYLAGHFDGLLAIHARFAGPRSDIV